MQRMAIFFCCFRNDPINTFTMVLLPTPGGPVIPITGVLEKGNFFNSSTDPGAWFSINEIQRAKDLILPFCISGRKFSSIQ